MNVIYKGARMLKDMYNNLNPATLTGAIDILVIEQENKELCASPFHVRFGKLGVLRAKEKLVNITINDEDVDLHMKLGDQGEAFFVVETDDEEIPARLLASPLPSRPVSPTNETPSENRLLSRDESTVKRPKRRRRRKRRSFSSQTNNDNSTEYSQSSDSEDDNHVPSLPSIEQSPSPKFKHPPEPQLSIDIQDDDDENDTSARYKRLCSVFSDSELPQCDDGSYTPPPSSPFSDSETMEHNELGTPLGWDWGELPRENATRTRHLSLTVPTLVKSKLVVENEKRYPKISEPPPVNSTSENPIENSKSDAKESVQPTSSTEGSPKKNARRPTEGLYLDEILDLEPNEANLYLSSKQQEKSTDTPDKTDTPDNASIDNARSRTPEAVFIADAGIDSGTDCLISDDAAELVELNMSSIKISLCGGRLESGKLVVDEAKFNEKLITYEQFITDPVAITNNSDLVILIGDRYYDWETAGPIFLSVFVFKKPLSNEILDRVIDKQISKKARAVSGSRLSWFWRRGSHRDSTSSTHSEHGMTSSVKDKEEMADAANTPKTVLVKSYSASPKSTDLKKNRTDESSSCEDEISLATGRKELKRAQTVQALFPHSSPKTMRKTTRLTSDQLKSLNLKPGANTVSFSVTSQYQGTSRCYATIYLWKHTDRLVVSDIDGTITKSDVFGQFLPVFGKDWTQGGVAQLYDNIAKNGYKFIYLSARAIGQAGMTKGYLNWINQQGVSLPCGPLFLSPTSLVRAFRTEVIEKKPEKFKIQCLNDIKALFPLDSMPLVAGFGNKINDVVAYTAVGIPRKRVFTINPRGELKPEDLQTYTTSYSHLGGICDAFFPVLSSEQSKKFSDTQEFSTFNFWREDVPSVELDELDIP